MEYLFIVTILLHIFGVNGDTVITYNLPEELPTATLIGNIANDSQLRFNMSTEELESVRYNFLDQSKMQALFMVDNENGNLRTSVVIDRENECGFTALCLLKFDIMAHSTITANFIIISVEIVLEDVNDNSPIFSPNVVNLQIQESAVIGTPLGIEDATDEDSSAGNGIQRYEIIQNDGPFILNSTRKSDGGYTLKLVLQKQLDREMVRNYQIYVIATDGGKIPNTGTLTVNVEVLDDNDNPPVFDQNVYNKTVKEGAAIGTSVATVHASDKDIGLNGEVFYRFNPKQSNLNEILNLFAIDENTGVITVAGQLVYQSGKVHEISVEASDKGQQPEVAQAIVMVTVLDVGNNPPDVRVTLMSSTNAGIVNVSESINVGSVMAHVTVEDTDSGPNGNVTCTISDNHFNLQVVQGKGYIVTFSTPLDREELEVHDVTITCSDQGSPPLKTSVSFMVYVSDENDSPPKFSQTTYFASIDENNAIGDIVTQISAKDQDLGKNAHLKYYLDTDAMNKFVINNNTGVLIANAVYDRETTLNYKFTVLAVDGGSPPLTGSATVFVTITDKNDNSPTFKIPKFQFFTRENMFADAMVGTLSASDIDEGPNGEVSFKLAHSSDDVFPFYVLQDGVIKTGSILDREQKSKYEFDIMAYDHGNPSQSSTIGVVVYVIDENDNKPIIMFPNKLNNTVSVSYSAPIGTIISQIEAHDRDEPGPNSQLTYSFISGNELDIFTIGKNTGKIYLKRTYQVEADLTFAVSVSVKDKGDNPLENVTNFFIILKYSNETFVNAVDEYGARNVIITVIVILITVIFSAIIIAVICIIRRRDNKTFRREEIKTMYTVATPQLVLENKPAVDASMLHEMEAEPSKKKKKEVSFTFNEDNIHVNDSYCGPVFEDSVRHHISVDQIYAKVNKPRLSTLQNLHLHQAQLQNGPKIIGTDRQRTSSSTDNVSDSSGEVTNSDSGKGGSDLDLASHLCKADDPGYARLKRTAVLNRSYDPPFYTEVDPDSIGLGDIHVRHSVDLQLHDQHANEHPEDWFPSYV